MITHFRNHLMYIFVASLVIYVGMFFSKVPGYFLKEGYYLHIVPMTLLVLNAFLICLLSLEISKDKIRARCMVLFYLLIPAHLDVFLFPYQWQMFVAESFLLISFLNFRVNEKKFLTSLIVAICPVSYTHLTLPTKA